MDNVLIVADTLASIIEKMNVSREIGIYRIEEEIMRISADKPWYKANLQRARELGLKVGEVPQLGIESVSSIDSYE